MYRNKSAIPEIYQPREEDLDKLKDSYKEFHRSYLNYLKTLNATEAVANLPELITIDKFDLLYVCILMDWLHGWSEQLVNVKFYSDRESRMYHGLMRHLKLHRLMSV